MRGHRALEPAVMDFDCDHLWHPYSSMTRPSAPYLTESASGTRLRLRVDAARIARIQAALRAGLAPAAGLESVREVRTLGAVGVVELDRPVDVPAVTRAALDAGVWVRPFRNLVHTMPPFVCAADDLATITTGIVSAVKQVHG